MQKIHSLLVKVQCLVFVCLMAFACSYNAMAQEAFGEPPSQVEAQPRLIIEREVDGSWGEMIDSSRDVWVGQRISLRARMSDGASINSITWSVPGSRVANYEASQSSTTKTPLTNLSSTSIIFKWYDRVNANVGFSGVSAGKSVSKSFNFNVKKPGSYLSTIAGQGDRKVTITNSWGNGWELSFGVYSAYGITFEGDLTTSVPGSTLKWYQVVTNSNRRYLQGSGWHYYRPTVGADKFVFPQEPFGGLPLQARDAPGMTLDGTWAECRIHDDFIMLLMFKPPGNGSIFVPLRSVGWFWEGTAINNAGWTLAPGSTSSINPTSSETATLPEWTNSIVPGYFVP